VRALDHVRLYCMAGETLEIHEHRASWSALPGGGITVPTRDTFLFERDWMRDTWLGDLRSNTVWRPGVDSLRAAVHANIARPSAPTMLKTGVGKRRDVTDTACTRRCPMHKKDTVRLSAEERGVCQEIVQRSRNVGKGQARADAAQGGCRWA